MLRKWSGFKQNFKGETLLNALNSKGFDQYGVEDMNSQFGHKKTHSGFTMVELLAVIMVIGLLAGMVMGIAGIATRKAAKSKAQAMFGKIEMALAEYYVEHKTYPLNDNFSSLDLWNSGDDGTLLQKLRGRDEGGAYNNRPVIDDDKALTGGSSDFGNARLIDPWGRNVKYRAAHPSDTGFKNTMKNPETYDLLMTGPDGIEYTSGSNRSDDDVRNW